MRRTFLLAALALLLIGVAVAFWLTYYPSDSRKPTPGLDTASLTAEAVPGHIEALRHPDAAVRQKAANALWQIGPSAKTATPALVESLKDPAPEVREMAAKGLGRTSRGTPDAVAALVQALKDKQEGVRAAAGASLSEIWLVAKGTEASPGRAPEREEEEDERRGEVKGTARSGRAERESGRARQAPGDGVSRLTPPFEATARAAVPVLMEVLHDSAARVRANVASALAEAGPLARPAVEDLLHLLQTDPDDNVRLQAVVALGYIGPDAKAAIPGLVENVRKEKVFGIRVNTVASLGMIGRDPQVVVPALVEAHLKDPEGEVRTWALRSMQRFGSAAPKIAWAALERLAKDPENQKNAEFQKRSARFREILESKLAEKATPAPTKPPSKS